MHEEVEGQDISVTSGVGIISRKPYVQLVWKNLTTQFTPEEARRFAYNIIECAEASICDSLVFKLLTIKIGIEDKAAARVLLDFREWRKEYED